jgi:hypothetical protein
VTHGDEQFDMELGCISIGGVLYGVYRTDAINSGLRIDQVGARILVPYGMSSQVARVLIFQFIISDLFSDCGIEIADTPEVRLLTRGILDSIQSNPEFYTDLSYVDSSFIVGSDGVLRPSSDGNDGKSDNG